MKKSKIYWIITVILGIALTNEMIFFDVEHFEMSSCLVFNTIIAMAITGFVALNYKHKNQ